MNSDIRKDPGFTDAQWESILLMVTLSLIRTRTSKVVRDVLGAVEGSADIQEECHVLRKMNYLVTSLVQSFLGERF